MRTISGVASGSGVLSSTSSDASAAAGAVGRSPRIGGGALVAVQQDAEHKAAGQGDNTDNDEGDERRPPGEEVHRKTGLERLALAAADVAPLAARALGAVLLALASTVRGHGSPRCAVVSLVSLLRLRVYEGPG